MRMLSYKYLSDGSEQGHIFCRFYWNMLFEVEVATSQKLAEILLLRVDGSVVCIEGMRD